MGCCECLICDIFAQQITDALECERKVMLEVLSLKKFWKYIALK